jgi:hypothetical protein
MSQVSTTAEQRKRTNIGKTSGYQDKTGKMFDYTNGNADLNFEIFKTLQAASALIRNRTIATCFASP